MQEYILAVPASAPSYTAMMCNKLDVDSNGKWQMLPVKLQLPSQLPQALRSYGSAWLVTGEKQSLVKSAVFAGVFLTVKTLEYIQSLLQYKLPEKGEGSGKHGGIVKLDHAKALVGFLWPNATEADKTRMIDALVGKALSRVKCSSDVIAAVKELGQEGERDFKHLHQVALNQEAVEHERKLRTPTAEREEKKTYTPKVLKDLLPDLPGVACSRNPLLCRYQAFHPGSVALCCFTCVPK